MCKLVPALSIHMICARCTNMLTEILIIIIDLFYESLLQKVTS